MTPASPTYDLVVIGSGPAGQKGAIAAAKLGKRVAVIDRLRHAGRRVHPRRHGAEQDAARSDFAPDRIPPPVVLRSDYVVKDRISIRDLATRVAQVVERETGVVRDQLRRNNVDFFSGTAHFVDAHIRSRWKGTTRCTSSAENYSDRLRNTAGAPSGHSL